jgi:hypothetical protein
MMNRPLAATLAAAILLLLTATGLGAQDHPFHARTGEDRFPITVVLVANAPAPLLMRRATLEPRNVVLLDSARAGPGELSDAIFALLALEANDSEGQERNDNLVHTARLSSPRPVYPWAAEALARLRRAERRRIAGVGDTGTIEVWVDLLRVALPARPQ